MNGFLISVTFAYFPNAWKELSLVVLSRIVTFEFARIGLCKLRQYTENAFQFSRKPIHTQIIWKICPPQKTAQFLGIDWTKNLLFCSDGSVPQVGNDKNLAGKRNAPRAVIPAQRPVVMGFVSICCVFFLLGKNTQNIPINPTMVEMLIHLKWR